MKRGASTRSEGTPYPGNRPFRRAEGGRFYGRATDALTLAELWQTNRLTVASGRAGAGKTSLLQAGVLPIASGKSADILSVGRLCHGLTFPFAALPEHNPYTLSLLRSWSPREAATRLVGLTVHDFLRARAERHDGIMLAAIDQVNDLVIAPGMRHVRRRDFLGELAQALRLEPRLHLLLVARDEAVELITGALGGGARYRVTGLTPHGAVEAMTGPTTGTGRSYALGAPEGLITDLQTSHITGGGGAERCVTEDSIEPSLLQAVCTRLWESLPPDADVVSKRDVRIYGDVDTALTAYCSEVIAAVADDHDLSTMRLRSWLIETFITELGTRGTTYQGAATTASMPNTVVRSLVDRCLLSVELRSGSMWCELLSDRLIEPLRKAFDERPPLAQPTDYLREAQRALVRGEHDLAARYAEAVQSTSSESDLRLRGKVESFFGNLANEQGKPVVAEEHHRAAATLFETFRDTPEVARQLAAVGQALLEQERPEDAVNELRAAVERMPGDPVLQTDLGLALWQLGDGPAAVAILTAVLGVEGGNQLALRARGEILAYLGEAQEAVLDLNRIAPLEQPTSQAALGLALTKLGDRAEANQQLDEALSEAPRNGVVLLYAAKAKGLDGDEVAAEGLARQAVDATNPALSSHYREVALELASHKQEEHIP